MPELPEIEALGQTIEARLHGRSPSAVRVQQFALVKTFDPPTEALIGQPLDQVWRHGKHLLFNFGNDLAMAVHLGIGGRLLLLEAASKPARGTSMDVAMGDGLALRLVELGTKKRSSVHVLTREAVAAHLAPLGIDALSENLTLDVLRSLLTAERAQLKHFLVNQHRIAGIGNAYSDEILWDARLAPLKMTNTLDQEEAASLHAAIGSVLTNAIGRAQTGNYLMVARGDKRGSFQVHRKQGEPCPRCGEPVASIHYAESSLQYCPACQAGGRRYADRRLSRLLR